MLGFDLLFHFVSSNPILWGFDSEVSLLQYFLDLRNFLTDLFFLLLSSSKEVLEELEESEEYPEMISAALIILCLDLLERPRPSPDHALG